MRSIIWILFVYYFLYAIKHAIGVVQLMLFNKKFMNHMVKRMGTNWESQRGLFQKKVINLNGFENMIF